VRCFFEPSPRPSGGILRIGLFFYSSQPRRAGYGVEDFVSVSVPRSEDGRWAEPGDYESTATPPAVLAAARCGWLELLGRDVPAQADGLFALCYDQCESGYSCGKVDILFDKAARSAALVEFERDFVDRVGRKVASRMAGS